MDGMTLTPKRTRIRVSKWVAFRTRRGIGEGGIHYRSSDKVMVKVGRNWVSLHALRWNYGLRNFPAQQLKETVKGIKSEMVMAKMAGQDQKATIMANTLDSLMRLFALYSDDAGTVSL